MKNNQTIDITFANQGKEKENKKEMPVAETEVDDNEISSIVETKELVEETPVKELEEETDGYAMAVERLFGAHQAFQEDMQSLTKTVNPTVLMGKLVPILETFQGEIDVFRQADYEVETRFQEGHGYLLSSLEKYETFLVDYPIVLSGKGGIKAMKKVMKLGKLSGEADKDIKKAFRSFDEALQEAK